MDDQDRKSVGKRAKAVDGDGGQPFDGGAAAALSGERAEASVDATGTEAVGYVDQATPFNMETAPNFEALRGIFTSQVTVSGSFDVRGGVWATTLGQIMQALTVPTVLVDTHHAVAAANDACSRIGLSGIELKGVSFCNLFRGRASQAKCETLLTEMFRSRIPVVWEAWLAGPDGDYWVRPTLRSVRIGKERFCLVLIEDLTRERELLDREAALCRDLEVVVSERTEDLRLANRRLVHEVNERRVSEEKYRHMVEALEEGYYELDLDGKIVFCNEALCRMLSRPRDALIGSAGCDHASGAAEAVKRTVNDAKSGKIEPAIFSFDVCPPEGKKRFIEASASAIVDSSGALSGFRGVCRDVTERKRREELEIQAERHKAVEDLAAGVAHNFNNLLQVVMGCAELAGIDLRAGEYPNVARYLDQVMKSCRFAADTVRRLRSFVGLRDTMPAVAPVVLDLAELVSRAVAIVHATLPSEAERESSDSKFDLQLESGCHVLGSKTELFEVVINLAQNAADAISEKGCVSVRLGVKGQQVILVISDTGVGIAPENLSRLFNPFFTTKCDSGAGLGLATAAKIIERHRGRIFADSTLGQGSVFTLELPLAEAGPAV